jgi:hypothetical protein
MICGHFTTVSKLDVELNFFLLLQHYRDVLKLLQTILNYTKVKDEDYSALLRVVQELQVGDKFRTQNSEVVNLLSSSAV